MLDPVHSRWVFYSRVFLQLSLVVCTTQCLLVKSQCSGQSPNALIVEVIHRSRGSPLVWYVESDHSPAYSRSTRLREGNVRTEVALVNPLIPLAGYGFAIALPLAIVPIPGRRRTLATYFAFASGLSLAASMLYSYHNWWIGFKPLEALELDFLIPRASIRDRDVVLYPAVSIAGALFGCVVAYPFVLLNSQRNRPTEGV